MKGRPWTHGQAATVRAGQAPGSPQPRAQGPPGQEGSVCLRLRRGALGPAHSQRAARTPAGPTPVPRAPASLLWPGVSLRLLRAGEKSGTVQTRVVAVPWTEPWTGPGPGRRPCGAPCAWAVEPPLLPLCSACPAPTRGLPSWPQGRSPGWLPWRL